MSSGTVIKQDMVYSMNSVQFVFVLIVYIIYQELGGRMCLVCPWHKYKVCIDTGQNYYQVCLTPFPTYIRYAAEGSENV